MTDDIVQENTNVSVDSAIPPGEVAKRCIVVERVQKRSFYDVYITGYIDAPYYYTDLLQLLSRVGSNDVVKMHINSGGGRVDTGLQIIHAMNACQATITTSLERGCSMAALIFLCGHECEVNIFSTLMIHSMSTGVYGKIDHIDTYVEHIKQHNDNVLAEICSRFLTKAEIKDVLENGKDLWFSSDEIYERLEKIK